MATAAEVAAGPLLRQKATLVHPPPLTHIEYSGQRRGRRAKCVRECGARSFVRWSSTQTCVIEVVRSEGEGESGEHRARQGQVQVPGRGEEEEESSELICEGRPKLFLLLRPYEPGRTDRSTNVPHLSGMS